MVPAGGSSGSRRCTEENQQINNKYFNLVHVKTFDFVDCGIERECEEINFSLAQ
jgi:hypothetical protein